MNVASTEGLYHRAVGFWLKVFRKSTCRPKQRLAQARLEVSIDPGVDGNSKSHFRLASNPWRETPIRDRPQHQFACPPLNFESMGKRKTEIESLLSKIAETGWAPT